jgi:predicted TIM-barrel fold metal-dependent hydrolase
MMIIDAHAHIYEILKGYGSKGEFRPIGGGRGIWATGKVEQFFPEEYGDTGFHAETLLKLMEEGGIDHAVLLQGGNYGFHNDYMAEAASKYPEKLTAVGEKVNAMEREPLRRMRETVGYFLTALSSLLAGLLLSWMTGL